MALMNIFFSSKVPLHGMQQNLQVQGAPYESSQVRVWETTPIRVLQVFQTLLPEIHATSPLQIHGLHEDHIIYKNENTFIDIVIQNVFCFSIYFRRQ